MAAPESLTKAGSKSIQTMEVVGRILQVLSRHDQSMLLGDIARATDLMPGAAHPYLVSLCNVRMVEQDQATGQYKLGALALSLGLAALTQKPALRRARLAMDSLKATVRHSVALAVWSRYGPMIVEMSEADFPFEANLRVGSVMSMTATATGRLCAAYMPQDLTQALIDRELERNSPEGVTAAQRKAFDALIGQTRKRGLDRAVGKPIPGVNALGAPVFDENGELALIMLVTGQAASFDSRWTGPIAKALRACCQEASANRPPRQALSRTPEARQKI